MKLTLPVAVRRLRQRLGAHRAARRRQGPRRAGAARGRRRGAGGVRAGRHPPAVRPRRAVQRRRHPEAGGRSDLVDSGSGAINRRSLRVPPRPPDRPARPGRPHRGHHAVHHRTTSCSSTMDATDTKITVHSDGTRPRSRARAASSIDAGSQQPRAQGRRDLAEGHHRRDGRRRQRRGRSRRPAAQLNAEGHHRQRSRARPRPSVKASGVLHHPGLAGQDQLSSEETRHATSSAGRGPDRPPRRHRPARRADRADRRACRRPRSARRTSARSRRRPCTRRRRSCRRAVRPC